MFSRFHLLIILGLFIMTVNSLNYLGSLTENECKTFLASNDINKKVQALLSCPKQWRSKPKKRFARQTKYFFFTQDENN